jgi:hypothetical protein
LVALQGKLRLGRGPTADSGPFWGGVSVKDAFLEIVPAAGRRLNTETGALRPSKPTALTRTSSPISSALTL